MRRRLLCYGDSNTYGYDSQSFLGERYPESVRWTAFDAAQAKRQAGELSPAVVVPMHYRQAGVGFDVTGTVDQFTKLCDDVVTYSGSELELTPQISR